MLVKNNYKNLFKKIRKLIFEILIIFKLIKADV